MEQEKEEAIMSKNVFSDLGFSEEEASGLKLRSYLFMALQEIIRNSKLSQTKIAFISSRYKLRMDHHP